MMVGMRPLHHFVVPLPRERGRIQVAHGIAAGSSPAKRGRGTMRSMVEGASAIPEELR
jgi:hypothetical protein